MRGGPAGVVPATRGTPPAGETFDVRNSLRRALFYFSVFTIRRHGSC